MNRFRLLLTLLAPFCLSAGFAIAAQDLLTIDASAELSAPARGRGPFPGSASPGHSVNLSARLALSIPSTELGADQSLLVDFVITNIGPEAIKLPSSVDPNIEQRTSVLTLWLTSDAMKDEYFTDSTSGRQFKLEMVRTSAALYGSSEDPGRLSCLLRTSLCRCVLPQECDCKPEATRSPLMPSLSMLSCAIPRSHPN